MKEVKEHEGEIKRIQEVRQRYMKVDKELVEHQQRLESVDRTEDDEKSLRETVALMQHGRKSIQEAEIAIQKRDMKIDHKRTKIKLGLEHMEWLKAGK